MRKFFQTNKYEFIGSLSTFATMAYIIIINAKILSLGGMDEGSVMVATILVTAFSSILMGLITNYPIALAPALSISPYLTYTVIGKNHFTWQQAMGAVFVSSVILLILNIINIRQKIVLSIPLTLRHATISGIGLFLVFIGLHHIGVLENSNLFVTFGSIFTYKTLLTLAAIVCIIILLSLKFSSAYILTLLFFWALALLVKIVPFTGLTAPIPSLEPTFYSIDISLLTSSRFWSVIISLLLITLIDTSAALLGLLSLAKIIKKRSVPNLKPSLFCDSLGSILGAFLGTGSLSFHLESTSGILTGAKKGLTAILTGVFFLGCLFFYPLVKTIPLFATSAVIIVIGLIMFKQCLYIPWKKSEELVPSVFLIVIMGFTLSIYNGLSIGFISYAFFKILTNKTKDVSPVFWVLSLILFIHRLFIEL